MAVTATQNLSSVKVYLEKGFDENSNRIISTKTFSNVYPQATAEDIVAVVNAIVALQKHTLYNLIKVDNTVLTQE